MVVKWLREHVTASALMVVLRLYLGYEWMMAGWGKITQGFDATGFLKGALAKAAGEHPAVQSWWAGFIEHVALPNVGLFNVLVPWGEFLVGIALILGLFTTFAALMGAVMNFAFMFSGTTSTNPQMVLLTVFLLVAGANAGRYGLDRWVLPYLRHWWTDKTHRPHRPAAAHQ
ncbi:MULTISPECIES: DoxX family protein [Geobacillus]|uniref:Crp/Fnr family transcriptional regulator n=1 Tax=Geobacillus thermocatenulatus TaxID=33938 RepID=A0A226QD42_9BACL|nr:MULTISPECIES: DoxX family protein [Geobacillus]ASS99145.1 Crp/Fnr family transcriptional regulator [Geobacillus thermocatenulatus]KLR73416.1 Crp/Fnr family transcriptional regulator [Geobacillus sp. T6]OXB89884.1 Crp/Fnr family transcriptional regulator [Geobacillus thermocatenulatus]RAN23067.1 Crp/Fnr family transcriptional regulator [Geobacillus sp. A8]